MPVDGSEMPVDGVGASSDNGDGARIHAFSMSAQHNRTLMSSFQLYNTAIFAFGNDAAIRSEAEALHQAAVTHLQAENREELRVAQNHLHAHYAECAQPQSHRIRECELRVSDEFSLEVSHAEARISRSCEDKAQVVHEMETRRKTSEFRQAIEVTLADAQQLLQEQAAKHADDIARVEATHARNVDMMAAQNRLLQEEIDDLNQQIKLHDFRGEDSKPKGVGDSREDSPELMTDDMKSARSQKSLLDPLSYPFQYAKEKLRSLVTTDGYEVEYTPSIMPPAEREALKGSAWSPTKTSAPVPLQFFQGPLPTDRKQGGKPPGGPPHNNDGGGDEDEGDGLGPNLGQEAFAKMLMKLVKGHTSDEKPRTRESETLRFKEMPAPETYREWTTSVREDVRTAPDRPDEACPCIMEVWSDREDKKKLLEELGEPGKFVTLDTKILAALTRSAKGDLAQRILTAKEECAKEGKAMRGRQVLFMFDQYFKTSEEAGNLYSVEDLLRVSRHGEGIIDLKRFLNAWESVIAGMNTRK